jgi:Lrp/AsnC family leucine-responsive transcriptional regulator
MVISPSTHQSGWAGARVDEESEAGVVAAGGGVVPAGVELAGVVVAPVVGVVVGEVPVPVPLPLFDELHAAMVSVASTETPAARTLTLRCTIASPTSPASSAVNAAKPITERAHGGLRSLAVTPPLEDRIDRQLAAMLVANGRATLKSLAEATGLSVSAVQARVRRLETDGVIRGYSANIDPDSVGLPLAAIIAINPLDPNHEYDIPERLEGLLEIESCHSVAGDASFMLFVRVGSPTALEGLIREIRRRANVSTQTTVVLQTFFERPAAQSQANEK